jgi:hypothetical protein
VHGRAHGFADHGLVPCGKGSLGALGESHARHAIGAFDGDVYGRRYLVGGVMITSPYPSATRFLQMKILFWLCQTDGDGVVDVAPCNVPPPRGRARLRLAARTPRISSQTNTCLFCALYPHSCTPEKNFPVGHPSLQSKHA